MAIKQGNFPYRTPARLRNSPMAYGTSLFGKIVISADTTLVVDTNDGDFYNLLLNDSADADTDLDIPVFLFPSGTMIEDIGIENFQVWTEAATLILGDTADSDGWVDSVSFVATDTDAIGVIKWMKDASLGGWDLSTAFMDDTTAGAGPAYFRIGSIATGGKQVVYSDSAYSTTAVVGLDSDDEPRPLEYAIHVHQKEAVAITGGLAVYVKYNFAPLQIREPSSNLGDTGD